MADPGPRRRVDLRPFAALRYRPEVAGDLSQLLAPPYDVIGPGERQALLRRSEFNVVRLELPEAGEPGADPYRQAADTLRRWTAEGAMARDGSSAFYLYEQHFEHAGESFERQTLFGRLRLEPWETCAVRPHELTMRAPKEDRLRLLRAARANVSPVYALYRDPQGAVAGLLHGAPRRLLSEATTDDGQRHRLWALEDADALAAISGAVAGEPLYVADGHHRYETALAHRDERREAAGAGRWTGEEAENFVLAGLTAAGDPGLLVLPIHRIVARPPAPGALERLAAAFEVEDAGAAATGAALTQLLERLRAAGSQGPAFAAVGLERDRFTLLTSRGPGATESRLPPDTPAAWREVDAAVLRYAVLEQALGLTAERLDDADFTYTEDAAAAVREVLGGGGRLAFLLNPTPVERILAVADAGARMPQKSTFFYPKLPTGLVLNPLD